LNCSIAFLLVAPDLVSITPRLHGKPHRSELAGDARAGIAGKQMQAQAYTLNPRQRALHALRKKA